jgi:tetratricopeptide (TPR) repeat protein
MNRDARRLVLVSMLVLLMLTQGRAQAPEAAHAAALEQAGNWAEAEQAWRAAVKSNPGDARAFASLGVVLAKEEKYSEAASAYRQALKLNPRLPGVELNLGLAEFKQGNLTGAIAPFKAALGVNPASIQAQTLLGMSYYGTGKFQESIPHLQIAAKSDPANAELRGVLAQACLNAKQYDCALEQYHRLVEINPDSAQVHMLAGEAYDGQRRTDEAIAEFQSAVKAAPGEPNVHFGLGYLLWEKQRYAEAAQQFQAELNNDSSHAQAIAYLGDCNLALSHPELAQPLLAKAAQLDPGIELAHLDLGIIDANAGRQDDALREFVWAEKLAPNDVNVHWRLGRLYRSEGKNAEAKAEFDKAKNITQAADSALVDKLAPRQTAPNSAAGKN